MKRSDFHNAVRKVMSEHYFDALSVDPERAKAAAFVFFNNKMCDNEYADVIREYILELNSVGYVQWDKEE